MAGKREFGVPSENLSPSYEAPGDFQTGLRPAPEILNLKSQLLSEQQKAARQKAVAEEVAEEWEQRTEWERNFSFGAVVKPEENTLRGYKYKLRENNGSNNIAFSPENYPVFDNVIVHECGLDSEGRSLSPAFNPNLPGYEDFAPLRRNIAILRNYLLVTMYPDGEYKPSERSSAGREDHQNNLKVQQMAIRLGKALKNSGGIKAPLPVRFFGDFGRLITGQSLSTAHVSKFMEAANVPDVGAAYMYDYLFNLYSKPSFWDSLPFVQSSRNWDLQPREQTPFSDADMLTYSTSSLLEETADRFDQVITQLNSVDKMSTQDRAVSVEHARTILEKLRILLGSQAIGAELNEITDDKQATAFMLLKTASAFEDGVAQIAIADPSLLRNPVLEQSVDALQEINYELKAEAEKAMQREGRTAAASAMNKRRAMTPAKFRSSTPLHELVPKVQAGMNEVSQIKSTLPTKSTSRQITRAPSPAQAPHPPVVNPQLAAQQFQLQAAKKARRDAELAAAKAAAKASERAHSTMTNVRISQASAPAKSMAQSFNETPASKSQKDQQIAPHTPGKSIY